MKYKVIIAEKPSVAAGIAKIVGANTPHREKANGYLEGNGFRVTWAFGHLVGLQSPEQMGFAPGQIPMFPEEWKTKIIGKRDKDGKEAPDPIVAKQMKILDSLFAGAEEIIVATDAGREGELIFRYIYEYLGSHTPFTRLWISSLTDEAIRKGLNEIKDGNCYQALSDAAHARSEADWLVGFNASRALRLYTGFKGMVSLGRVQTPTLGMICQRYEDNKNFVPTPFWQISVDTEKSSTQFNVLSEEKYKTEDDANLCLGKVKAAKQLKVLKVEKKRSKTTPPLLYDLTALQRAANSKYGLTADETLKVAQSLYEKKFTTYPRTGSRYVPEDVYRTIPDLLKKVSNLPELGPHAAALAGKKLCRKSVNDAKVTDHHALLPTGVTPSGLTPNEEKIYRLICGRMIEAFGEDFIADVTKVTLWANEVIFKTRGSVPVYMGWKAVFGGDTAEDKKDDDEEKADSKLPEMAEGDLLPINKAEVLQKTDKPLPIYTDSSLLGEMETCGKKIDDEEMREAMKDVGLGTPATRAATIEALIQRQYVVRQAKKLLPTELGLQIWNIVKGRKISDVKTTGEWERDLALVEQGKKKVGIFKNDITGFVGEILEDLKANCVPIDSSITAEPTRTCPFCGHQMKNMKFSIFCDDADGGCGFKVPREVCGKKLPAAAINALCKGTSTTVIKGMTSKSGKKFDAALKVNKDTKKVEFDFGGVSVDTSNVKCPCCGQAVKDSPALIECQCGFKLWKKQGGVKLSEKQITDLLAGKTVSVYGMKSQNGKTYNAKLTVNTETKNIDKDFINKKK